MFPFRSALRLCAIALVGVASLGAAGSAQALIEIRDTGTTIMGSSGQQIHLKNDGTFYLYSHDGTLWTVITDAHASLTIDFNYTPGTVILDGSTAPLLYDTRIAVEDPHPESVVKIRGTVGTRQTDPTTDEQVVIDARILLDADARLQSDQMTLTQPVDGAYNLDLDALLLLTIRQPVGATTPLASLDATVSTSINIATSGITTSGPQTYNRQPSAANPPTMRVENRSFTFSASRVDLNTTFLSCGSEAPRACDIGDTITFDVTEVRSGANTGTVLTVPLGESSDPTTDPAVSSPNTFNVEKAGPGTLTLTGQNYHLGTTTVSGGTLRVEHANALSTTARGTIVNSGATLEVAGVALAAEPLTISGGGVGDTGALIGSGTSSTSSTIDIAATARIGAASGATFTVGGAVTGSHLLTTGPGRLVLSSGANDQDSTSVVSGTLVAGHASALRTAEAILIDAGATLEIPTGVTLAAGSGTIFLGSTGISTPAVLDLPAGGTLARDIVLGGVARIEGGTSPSPILLTGDLDGAVRTLTLDGVMETPALTNLAALTVTGGSTATVDDGVATTGATTIDGTLALRTIALPRIFGITASQLAGSGQITTPAGLGGTLELDLSGDAMFAGGISNGEVIEVIKRGAGTLTLSGTPSYQGATLVQAGGLRVTGILTATSGLAMSAPTTLSGNGAVGDVTLDGTLDLQSSGPETLAAGNFFVRAGSSYRVAITGAGASRVDAAGTVALNGSPDLAVSLTGERTDGSSVVIIANDGPDATNGTFADLPEGATVTPSGGQGTFRITYTGGDGNDVALIYVAPPAESGPQDPPGQNQPGQQPPRGDSGAAPTANELTVTKPRLRKGVLLSTATVTGPGRIVQVATTARGRAKAQRVCRITTRAQKAGPRRLSCRLTPQARTAMKRRPLRVTVTTTFTPAGGTTITQRTSITLPRSR